MSVGTVSSEIDVPRLMNRSFAYVDDVLDGLDQAPAQLARVLTGRNFGKSLIRIAP